MDCHATKEVVGEALAATRGEHEADGNHLQQGYGKADGKAQSVPKRHASGESGTIKGAKFDGHQAHTRRGRVAREADKAIQKADAEHQER